MTATGKMERPILDVNQLGDLADYGLEEVTPEAVSAAYWDRRFPVIEGGVFDNLDISDLNDYAIEQKPWYKGAVDGVAGGLKGIGKWLYDNSSVLQAYDRWVDSLASQKTAESTPVLSSNVPRLGQAATAREAKPAEVGVTPLTTEELRQRSENSWLGKNFREGLKKAPKVDKAALLLAGVDIATLAAGFGIGYLGTGSGGEAMLGMELRGATLACIGQLGIIVSMRSERAIEGISEAESRHARVVQSLQRGCANHAVRAVFQVVRNLGAGAVAGSGFHYVMEMLSVGQQVAAGAPAPTEVRSAADIANAIGDTRREDIEAARQGMQQAAQVAAEQISTQDVVGQSEAAFMQANQVLSAISPDLSGDSSVRPLVDSAQQALRTANQFYSDAMASGGIDPTEAAKLQDLASQAQAAVDQAVNMANQIQRAAADAGAATEAARQGILQAGQVMKDVIAATPSGTAFEALQQQAFQATASPYAAETANALSWTLSPGDISGLHEGAIKEGAKTVAGLLQQAHDFAAANGGEYTVHAIRQAVSDGLLAQDVLHAVEAANLPAGAGKNQAIESLNTVLQSIVR